MKKPKEKFPGLKSKVLKGASLGPFECLSRSNKTIWDSKKPKEKTYWVAKSPTGVMDILNMAYKREGVINRFGKIMWNGFAKKEGWKIVKVKLVEV